MYQLIYSIRHKKELAERQESRRRLRTATNSHITRQNSTNQDNVNLTGNPMLKVSPDENSSDDIELTGQTPKRLKSKFSSNVSLKDKKYKLKSNTSSIKINNATSINSKNEKLTKKIKKQKKNLKTKIKEKKSSSESNKDLKRSNTDLVIHNNTSSSLPEGWSEHVDKESGKTYWWNSQTNESVWENPSIIDRNKRTDSQWT